MGLGGGMVLIVYLTVFAGFSQLAAQGINLVFFIPIAIISLVLHTKNKLVEWKKAVPAVLWGTAASCHSEIDFHNCCTDWVRQFF
jgi:uncharacterized membrane protein YfcA